MELQTGPGELATPEAVPPPRLGLRLGRRAAWLGGLLALAVAGYLLAGVFTVATDEQAVERRFGRVAARLGPGIHYRLPWPVDRVDVVKTTSVMKTGVGFDLPESEGAGVTGMEILTGDTNIISVALVRQHVANAGADGEKKTTGGRAYATDLLPRARGEARSTVLAAQSYKEQRVAEAIGNTPRFLELLAEYNKAPDVTRTRLYLEAMEKILPKLKKYVIDSEHGQKPINLRLGPTPP